MDSILQSGRGGGLYARLLKLPMQELELKMQGGLMREGGHNCGILRYYSETDIMRAFGTVLYSGKLLREKTFTNFMV